MKKGVIVVALSFLSSLYTYSQWEYFGSASEFREQLKNARYDTTRLRLYMRLSNYYVFSDRRFVQVEDLPAYIDEMYQGDANGIPKNLIDKIFQPSFTTKPTGQGAGLGISLAYDIIKAHAGEIKVDTKEGEGSTFIVDLPLQL